MRTRAVLVAATLLVSALPAAAGSAASRGPRCFGKRPTIVGSGKADVLMGTAARDVILGSGGGDRIDGLNGDDRICGGKGTDTIRGGGGSDALAGNKGNDAIDGDGGNDTILGAGGINTCFQGIGRGISSSCVPVVAAAGDIACDPADPEYNGGMGTAARCHMRATSDLVLRTNLAAVLALGDIQYEDGAFEKFVASYDPSWGRFKAITRPVPGNHEYGVPGANGYFSYFGAAAGDPATGYYSFDLGGWHLIGLNSECSFVSGGCADGSPQDQWLDADLAAHPVPCTLAFWHQPRFSSAVAPQSNPEYSAFWQTLHSRGADLVLNGHAHIYERFAPQAWDGSPDPARGIRQFIVGTGGRSFHPIQQPVQPNSEVAQGSTYGILELALQPTGYAWRFVPEAEGSFTDAGSGVCH